MCTITPARMAPPRGQELCPFHARCAQLLAHASVQQRLRTALGSSWPHSILSFESQEAWVAAKSRDSPELGSGLRLASCGPRKEPCACCALNTSRGSAAALHREDTSVCVFRETTGQPCPGQAPALTPCSQRQNPQQQRGKTQCPPRGDWRNQAGSVKETKSSFSERFQAE